MQHTKKPIALLLIVVLCLHAVAAFAEPTPFESLSATIELPEGMTLTEDDSLTDEMIADNVIAEIADASGNKLIITWDDNDAVVATDLFDWDEAQVDDLAAQVAAPNKVTKAELIDANIPIISIEYTDEIGEARIMQCFSTDSALYVVTLQDAQGGAPSQDATQALLNVLYSIHVDTSSDGDDDGGETTESSDNGGA